MNEFVTGFETIIAKVHRAGCASSTPSCPGLALFIFVE